MASGRPVLAAAERRVEQVAEDLVRVEVRLGELASGPAVPLVVGVDGGQGFGGLRQRREAEDPFPVRKEGTWARILDHRRLPAGQVAEGPVADPGVLEPHAGGLAAAELAARALDVRVVHLGGPGDLEGMADVPAVALHAVPVSE